MLKEKLNLDMTSNTPDRPCQNRRVLSPLHEMDGTEEELQPEQSDTKLPTRSVSMHALAEVVRTEIHEAIAPVKTKLGSMQVMLERRLVDVEDKVDAQISGSKL
jgi:hypothetical protein